MINKKYFKVRTKCPLCNSKKIKILFMKKFNEIKTNLFFSKHLNKNFPMKILDNNFYKIAECQICGIIFQSNILNKKYNEKFYDEYIDHKSIIINKNFHKLNENFYNKEVKLLEKIYGNKKINILEFGAGMGSWVLAMKNAGYQNISAVEISKKRRQFLKKKNINCKKSLSNFKNKFDLIYSDQTFEHLADPGKVIKSLIGLLNKNGCFFFKVPPGRFFKRKLNENYLAQKDEATPLEHINIFTKDSVQYFENKYKLQKINLFKIFELNSFKYLISDIYQNFVGKKYLYRK